MFRHLSLTDVLQHPLNIFLKLSPNEPSALENLSRSRVQTCKPTWKSVPLLQQTSFLCYFSGDRIKSVSWGISWRFTLRIAWSILFSTYWHSNIKSGKNKIVKWQQHIYWSSANLCTKFLFLLLLVIGVCRKKKKCRNYDCVHIFKLSFVSRG